MTYFVISIGKFEKSYLGNGIVLLYHGKNSEGDDRDKSLPKGTYSVGKVVFDLNNWKK